MPLKITSPKGGKKPSQAGKPDKRACSNGRIKFGSDVLGEVLKTLPDDEVYPTREIDAMVYQKGVFAGRTRNWIHRHPGNYIVTSKGMMVGSKKAIQAFCDFYNIDNPWQK